MEWPIGEYPLVEENVHKADDYKKRPGRPQNRRRQEYGAKRAESTMGRSSLLNVRHLRHEVQKQTKSRHDTTQGDYCTPGAYRCRKGTLSGEENARLRLSGLPSSCMLHTAQAYSNMIRPTALHTGIAQIARGRNPPCENLG